MHHPRACLDLCLSLLGYKAARLRLGSSGMTAVGWDMGQKMRQERRQVRPSKDPGAVHSA